MGIFATHFDYYLSKQQSKGIYLAVKIGGIDVNVGYEINKPSVNTKFIAVCAIKKGIGVPYEFSSITKAAEFLVFF